MQAQKIVENYVRSKEDRNTMFDSGMNLAQLKCIVKPWDIWFNANSTVKKYGGI